MKDIITVTGNIATDPEQRPLPGGETVTSFRLASTERRLDPQTRAWIDAHTNYYSVSAFRSLGRNAYTALRKGQRVIVTGRLRMKEWDNGTKRGVTAEIDAEGIGHDLLFGVTSFERSNQPAAADPEDHAVPAAPAHEEGVAPLTSGIDGWTVPQTVGAGVGSGADDTPF